MWRAGATLHRGTWPSLVARRFQAHGLQWLGHMAPAVLAQWLRCTGLIAPSHVGSFQTRSRTSVPCIARWTLNHWSTREVLCCPAEEGFLRNKLIRLVKKLPGVSEQKKKKGGGPQYPLIREKLNHDPQTRHTVKQLKTTVEHTPWTRNPEWKSGSSRQAGVFE